MDEVAHLSQNDNNIHVSKIALQPSCISINSYFAVPTFQLKLLIFNNFRFLFTQANLNCHPLHELPVWFGLVLFRHVHKGTRPLTGRFPFYFSRWNARTIRRLRAEPGENGVMSAIRWGIRHILRQARFGLSASLRTFLFRWIHAAISPRPRHSRRIS